MPILCGFTFNNNHYYLIQQKRINQITASFRIGEVHSKVNDNKKIVVESQSKILAFFIKKYHLSTKIFFFLLFLNILKDFRHRLDRTGG